MSKIQAWSVLNPITLEILKAGTYNPQNGGYPVMKPEKREHRDPYAGWWDEQERRDYNEVVHEDNDILEAKAL